MPRKNNSKPHTYYQMPKREATKRRFATRAQADAAAEERMLLHPELTLSVYQGLDGGWYLTSNKKA